MKAQSDRIIWVDYARVLGNYFVFMTHFAVNAEARFFPYFMPLFFILSGFIDNNKRTFPETIKRNFKTLIVPYIAFSIITYVWWLIIYFRHESFNPHDAFISPLIGMLLGDPSIATSNPGFAHMTNGPLWFLFALFWCKLVFKAGFFHKYLLLAINVCCVALILLLKQSHFNLYFSIDSGLMALPFYTFGFYLKRVIDKPKYQWYQTLLIVIAGITASYFLSRLNGKGSMVLDDYGKNIFLFYINGIVFSLSIMFFSRLFSNVYFTFLAYMGRNSIIIFGMQYISIWVVEHIYKIIMHTKGMEVTYGSFEAFVISFALLLVSFIPVYIIRTYFPYIIGAKKQPSKNKTLELV